MRSKTASTGSLSSPSNTSATSSASALALPPARSLAVPRRASTASLPYHFDPLALQIQQERRDLEARVAQARVEKAAEDAVLAAQGLLPEPVVVNPFENPIISLTDFVREGWEELEPGTPLAWNWHIDTICAHLEAVSEGLIRRLLVNVPPGHSKSLLISVFWPAWVWLHQPSWRMLCASSGLGLAVRDSGKCKDLVMSAWYQERFQPSWKIRTDTKAKQFYTNTETGMRRAVSVGAATTGFRGNAVLIDDPLQVMDATSETKREEANTWVSKAAASRLSNPRTGAIVMIMQRLHHDDPSAHVLKNKVVPYEHVCLPSYFEPENAFKTSLVSIPKYAEHGKDPRTKPRELLFPQFFNQEALDEAEENLREDFLGQHQQRPTPATGNMFKAEMFCPDPEGKTFFGADKIFGQKQIEAYLCWDTAAKAGAKNDFSAGSLITLAEDGFVYLVPLVLERMEVPAVEKKVLLTWAEWRVALGPVLQGSPIEEGASNATAVVQYSRRLMAHKREREVAFQQHVSRGGSKDSFDWKPPHDWTDEEWGMVVSAPPFHPLPFSPPGTKKVLRARGVLSYCQGRAVRLVSLRDELLTRTWLGQMLAFPLGAHDDAVDSSVTGIERFAGVTRAASVVDDDWMSKVVRSA